MRTRTIAAVMAVKIGVYALVVRPRLVRWGATDEEASAPYPGAVAPPGPRKSTMAVTIDASPGVVWPWLVQMGCDRAGWYSWDCLDNGGVPSAERVHAEWQAMAVGDRWASTSSGRAWFEVVEATPERFLALRASEDCRGRPFDPAGARPRCSIDVVWSFLLDELPDGRTRLVAAMHGSAQPRALVAVADFLFWEPAHWIMQTRQLANLKLRAERPPGLPAPAASAHRT